MSAINKRVHIGGAALADGATVDPLGGTRLTVYVVGTGTITAGAVQLEGSPTGGTGAEEWSPIGAALAAAADGTVYQSANEAHRFVRARISTAIVGGTVDVYVVVGGPLHGGWTDT